VILLDSTSRVIEKLVRRGEALITQMINKFDCLINCMAEVYSIYSLLTGRMRIVTEVFLRNFRQIPVYYLIFGHDRFIPHSLQFTVPQ
jgi:hypothetical protein